MKIIKTKVLNNFYTLAIKNDFNLKTIFFENESI